MSAAPHSEDFAQRIEMALRTGNRTRRDDVVALLAAYERLRGALKDAIDCVEDWGGYADDYFKEKWDLDGDLARLRAALSGSPEGDDQ